MTAPKPLCGKHRAEFDDWADWGPHRPLLPGLTMEMVDSQLALVKGFCAGGRNCGDASRAYVSGAAR